MMTPFDWQEAMGQRAQYVAGRLSGAIPVLAVSCADGIVLATFSRVQPKIYEIYDELVFAAIGQSADVEQMRVAAIEFAHREGYQRSKRDVSIQRVVQTMSMPMKSAFNDYRGAPLVAKCLYAEVRETPADDMYYLMDYDGDYLPDRRGAVLTGLTEPDAELENLVNDPKWADANHQDAVTGLRPILELRAERAVENDGEIQFEACWIRRGGNNRRRFYRL